MLLLPLQVISQVGIGTLNPTKSLDINGDLRIRLIPDSNESSILNTDSNGNVGKFNTFLISDAEGVVAEAPVNSSVSNNNIVNDIDLGMSITVNVPSNKLTLIIINYSVPVGMADFSNPSSYYGIRFMRNGVEEESGSRKYSLVDSLNANMVTISNVYIELIQPSATPQSISYELLGYVELNESGTYKYRFNMWSNTGNNFNWGKASMSKIVYIK